MLHKTSFIVCIYDFFSFLYVFLFCSFIITTAVPITINYHFYVYVYFMREEHAIFFHLVWLLRLFVHFIYHHWYKTARSDENDTNTIMIIRQFCFHLCTFLIISVNECLFWETGRVRERAIIKLTTPSKKYAILMINGPIINTFTALLLKVEAFSRVREIENHKL